MTRSKSKTYQSTDLDKIECYGCGKKGHYRTNCPEKTNVINNILKQSIEEQKVDIRKIQIDGLDFDATFDTGACASFITSGYIESIKNKNVFQVSKEFTFINGEIVKIKRGMKLEIVYENRNVSENFYIIENRNMKSILLGNSCVKRLIDKMSLPIECEINTGNAYPISWNRPIRSIKDKQEFQEVLDTLEKKGIIEDSKSLWLNPVVLVRKKDKKLRFCIDLRRLNDLVELDRFELPRINQLMTYLTDMKYYTLIDLKDGFFHVNIRHEDKEKTTFYTGKKLMQFTKMPQGYKNAPAIFQRTMNLIFKDLIENGVLIYIDDILMYAKNKIQHDILLKKVLETLQVYGLTENKNKRIECVNTIRFLGYDIGFNTIKPLLNRIQGIQTYKDPKNKKELQRFIGLLNYDRMFIKNTTDKLKLFYKLLENDIKFVWGEKEKEKFNEIKETWSQQIELIIPNLEKPFVLETDASDNSLGACLRQENKPVAYISRTLNKAEKNYGITEKEVLAALWAMEKFRYYLEGCRFTLETDHRAIAFIKRKMEFGSKRILRWFERINHFDFDVKYKKGQEVVVADALSRSNKNEEENDFEDQNVINEVIACHVKCNHRKNIKHELEEKGIILTNNKINDILKLCETCIRKDKSFYKSRKFVETNEPGELIAFDTMEIKKDQRIILGIDYFTRKIFGKFITSKDSSKIKDFIEAVYKVFPFKKPITDNGRVFSNNLLKVWTKETNIEHTYSIPHCHQSNGRIERANRTIREALKKTEGSIKTKLSSVIENYNNMIHRGIGMSPNQACLLENRKAVANKTFEYKKEFLLKSKNCRKFHVGDQVIIKNEIKKNKMDDEYKEEGVVTENPKKNVYKIKSKDKKYYIRHGSQLRLFGRRMLNQNNRSEPIRHEE